MDQLRYMQKALKKKILVVSQVKNRKEKVFLNRWTLEDVAHTITNLGCSAPSIVLSRQQTLWNGFDWIKQMTLTWLNSYVTRNGGWSVLNIEKELKSRIWHCLYTAVQREKIHHLRFMNILVTRKVICGGQEYVMSPHHGLAERSVSLYWFHIHQASILIIHLTSWYKYWCTGENANEDYVHLEGCVHQCRLINWHGWDYDH